MRISTSKPEAEAETMGETRQALEQARDQPREYGQPLHVVLDREHVFPTSSSSVLAVRWQGGVASHHQTDIVCALGCRVHLMIHACKVSSLFQNIHRTTYDPVSAMEYTIMTYSTLLHHVRLLFDHPHRP